MRLYTLLKNDNNNYAYSIHDFAQKRSKRGAKLERPNILLLPETLGSPQKFLILSVLPNHICSFQYQLHVRTERGGLGAGWAEGGSVLTLGHAGHYVPIYKPIGEVRLICANAAS